MSDTRCEWCAPEYGCFDGSKPCSKEPKRPALANWISELERWLEDDLDDEDSVCEMERGGVENLLAVLRAAQQETEALKIQVAELENLCGIPMSRGAERLSLLREAVKAPTVLTKESILRGAEIMRSLKEPPTRRRP